jgi:hypothetical protein
MLTVYQALWRVTLAVVSAAHFSAFDASEAAGATNRTIRMLAAQTSTSSHAEEHLSSSTADSEELSMIAPAAHSSISGTITFQVHVKSLPNLHSIEYLLNGKPLYNSGDPVKPITTAPYSLTWNTFNVWDGFMTVQAIGRDVKGKVIVTSPSVPLQIANGTTTLTLLSPAPGQTVSGTVNWTLQTNYPNPAQKILNCFIDGRGAGFAFTPNQQYTFPIDTTQFQNGAHELSCALWVEGHKPNIGLAMSQVQVQFNNGRSPMELRSNFRELDLAPGDTVNLAANLVYTNLDEAPVAATFTSQDSSVVNVDGSGLVTAMAPGVTTITVVSGSRSMNVRVIVNSSHIFPHFGRGGQILTSYQPGTSIFLSTMFSMDGATLVQQPNLGPQVRAAALNAITTGFYYNPADYTPTLNDWTTWKNGFAVQAAYTQAAIHKYDLGVFLSGEGFARGDPDLYDSIANPQSLAKIQYAFTWAKNTGRVIGVDMVDETNFFWGDTPSPSDGRWLGSTSPWTSAKWGFTWRPIPDNGFTTLMNIINGVSGRAPISWPVLGPSNVQTVKNWQGNPAFADFATMYWTFAHGQTMYEYPWAFSTNQVLSNIDATLLDRLPVLQRNKPLLSELSSAGPYYMKQVAGSQYTPGQDQLLQPGVSPETLSAEILYSAATGFAGVRIYGFDSSAPKYSRQAGAIGSVQQTFCDPFQVGIARWQAMSAALNLIKTLEPYLLQPQANAIDLGPTVYTAAKDGPNGRLLIAINSLETSQTGSVNLSPYLYPNTSSMVRYRLHAAMQMNETLPAKTGDMLTLAPGEVVVWLIRSPNRQDARPVKQ